VVVSVPLKQLTRGERPGLVRLKTGTVSVVVSVVLAVTLDWEQRLLAASGADFVVEQH